MIVELFNIFAANILPILIIAGLGYLVGKKLGVEPKPFSTVMFYILSPSLVFHSLSTSEIRGDELVKILSTMIVFQATMAVLAFLAVRWQPGTSVEKSGTIISTFCLNAGNFGLSLVRFAFPAVLPQAIIAYVANIILNYTLGVYVASSGSRPPYRAFLNILRTPAVYAIIGAFFVRGFSVSLPTAISRSVELLAEASIPVMIILLGLQLGQTTRLSKFRMIGTGVSLKLLVAPFIATALVIIFGLDAAGSVALILQASMPTAVLTIILATEFDLDRELSLNLILASTLFSPITLSIVILMLQQTYPTIANLTN